jgi:hypothetical protein
MEAVLFELTDNSAKRLYHPVTGFNLMQPQAYQIAMYWNKQEQFIFDIVLFTLTAIQMATIFALKAKAVTSGEGAIFAGINVILFMAMIPYAKWVWKITSYQKAFLQVVKHELTIIGLIAIGVLLTILTSKLKGLF